MKPEDKDRIINDWLSDQPIEPRSTFTEETVNRARMEMAKKRMSFHLPLAAAAALAIGIYVSMSGWNDSATGPEENSLYSNSEYLELEELLLLNESIDSLANATSNYTEPEYYW